MKELRIDRVILVLLLVLIGGSLSISTAAELDKRYKRNGEAYLLIGKESELPAGNIDYRGIWRLSDPEGIFSGVFPQYLVGEVDILDMAIDLNRNIHTLSDPKTTAIGDSFKIKRQVIDTVSIADADKGCHAYIHTDHRGSYWGYQTDVYRTGPAGRGIWKNGSTTSNPKIWSGFKSAGPGVETTAPDNPDAYMPSFKPANLQLGVYSGKKWYEIPNGAWYSSWNYKKGCQWFYQVFADKVTGTQYDWSLQQWKPNTTATSYTKQAGNPFATTYDMQIKRATLAGCLDGCGGASGDDAVKTDKMIFSSAFMPMVDKLGNATSRTYFYSRPEGKSNYSISTTGEGSANYVLKGDAVGYEKVPDTQWLGVSMKSETSDYLYCLGNSVIKKWIKDGGGNSTGINIAAVTVSNQWNQKGGIVFAFDEKEKMVYKFERDEAGAHNNTAFPISGILSDIGADADAKIDDIKADGDGNLFVGLTFPGVDLTVKEVTSKWGLGDAYTYEVNKLVPGDELQKGLLLYKQEFTKSVFRISAMGEPPKEVGKKVIATQVYKRNLAMPPLGWQELEKAGMTGVSGIVASWTTAAGGGTIGDFSIYANKSTDPDIGRARIAVINVPKPPDVLSLGNDLSYLDLIGAYKNSIPIFDPNKRSTEQNSAARFSGNLDTRQLYFYMVENYPIPTGIQNPSVTPDYDGDGRYGGFISTIINPNPSTDTDNPGTIRYYWRTWMVARQKGKDLSGNPEYEPVCPPEPMCDQVAGSYFHWFYTPIGGKFIVTCRVDYDWYDYSLIPFGTTITKFLANPGNAYKKATKAVPSTGGIVHEQSSNRMDQIMDMTEFTFMKKSAAAYKADILGSDGNKEYYAAIPAVVTDKDPKIPTDTFEIARIQRCDVAGNNPLTATHWYPQSAGVMNPTDGFHGIQVGTAYHWRMDVASQAIFYQDLEKAKNSANYTFISNKLTDSSLEPYYVNGDPEFQFDKTGDDLRWSPGSTVSIEAYLKYPVPPLVSGKPTIVQHNLGSDITEVKSQSFAYFTTKADLPPTDPFEAELVIEMSRLFQYDMRIYGTINGVKRLLGKVPNLPKKLTITSKTKVLITDTVPPLIAFGKTSPQQLYGYTGRALESGTNGNPASIKFQVTDNDPWDGVSGISSHAKYSSLNIAANKKTIDTYYNKAQSAQYNLKPVFNLSNSGVQLSWSTAIANAKRQIALGVNPYMPSYGSFSPGTGLGTPVIACPKNESTGLYYSTTDFDVSLSTLNSGKPIDLPKFYANNTPGYKPYEFQLSLRDSSGNESLDNLLNLVIQVRDDIPADPYGIVQEFKGNTTARFPSNSAIANDADFEANYRAATAFNSSFITRGAWLPTSPGSNKNGEIWDGTYNTGFKSLWSVSDTISALPETMKNTTITPGSIQVEDNVEVLMRVGAADNAGAATAKLTFSCFDIAKAEKTLSTGSSTCKLPGISADQVTSTQASIQALFREGKIKFPIAIPITIQSCDDARDWDKYLSGGLDANGIWNWGTLTKGSADSKYSNRRTFKTTLPVYGSELTIRTIESGVRTPGK